LQSDSHRRSTYNSLASINVKSPLWQKGYNDGQNDFKAGQRSDDLAHAIIPFNDYRAGYSQGYIDARDGIYLSCP
jgi:hypothetical protein